jgi:hypothetical protein
LVDHSFEGSTAKDGSSMAQIPYNAEVTLLCIVSVETVSSSDAINSFSIASYIGHAHYKVI